MTKALVIENLHAWYEESHALHGVHLNVSDGEVVTLLGRNGAGRTTTLRSIMGMISKRKGSIKVYGNEIINLPTYKVAQLGIGLCPEERAIFASLSCEENLLLPPILKNSEKKGMSLEKIYELFPNLYERRTAPGMSLSGGEQQMLAIARILRTGAKILLLDEISEGLAPVVVKSIGETIKVLRNMGYTIIMVEQNADFATPLTDRFYIYEYGKVVAQASNLELKQNRSEYEKYISV